MIICSMTTENDSTGLNLLSSPDAELLDKLVVVSLQFLQSLFVQFTAIEVTLKLKSEYYRPQKQNFKYNLSTKISKSMLNIKNRFLLKIILHSEFQRVLENISLKVNRNLQDPQRGYFYKESEIRCTSEPSLIRLYLSPEQVYL